jgi:hypothetical protein
MEPVARFICILLAVVLGTPALGWGASLQVSGIELVAAPCCGTEADPGDASSEPRLEKACCCKPRPIPAAVESLRTVLTQKSEWPQAGPVRVLMVCKRRITTQARGPITDKARAPPPSDSLLAQHTSLIL